MSILQMPNGVPVATVALDAAKNAGILAVQILSTADIILTTKLKQYKVQMQESVLEKVKKISVEGWDNGFDK